jgi:hypothetical protein
MTMLAIVTFDLHGAPPSEYPRVKAALAKRRLKKEIRSKKSGKLSKLPANTFAAEFKGKWAKKKARKLCDYLKNEFELIRKSLGLNASVFVVVGSKWAWSKR